MSDATVDPAARTAAAVHTRADVAALVVHATADLGATLVRYAPDGTPGDEIWYGSADEARSCAVRDYGGALGPWRPIPPDERDPVGFVRRD